MKLVFATNNQNKIKEVQILLPDNIELLSLKDIGCFEDIEETENTLYANAKLKADYITKNFGYDCFADDTGLLIDYLNDEPGVYSARYSGENATSEQNMQKVLSKMDKILNRKAQFETVISLNLKGEKYFFKGVCKGDILTKKQGVKGFGYDPIFKPERFEKSFAEMTLKEKGKISHRGLAIAKLVSFLNDKMT